MTDQSELFARHPFGRHDPMKTTEHVEFRAPIARNDDPSTSQESARETRRTIQEGHCRTILERVRAHPGRISEEYGDDIPGYWKRVSDLKNAGQIRYGEPKKSERTHRNCNTIWPVE